MIDYKKALEEIKNWKGIEKEYWIAVDILKKYKRLKETELASLNKGLTCYTFDLIVLKFKTLNDEAKNFLSKPKFKKK